MGCLAEMAVSHPTSGAFGAYAEHYIGPLAGFLVRYAYWSAIVLAVGTEISAVAIYMQYWFPTVPGWYWILGVLGGADRRQCRQRRHVRPGRVRDVAVQDPRDRAVPGARHLVRGRCAPESGVGFQNYTALGGFFPKGLGGVWVAVIVAIFSYLSVEMIAVAAGEAKEPERAMPRAFRSTVLRLILFYLVTLALVLAIVPWRLAGDGTSPFVKVMQATHVPGAAGFINLVILVAALSAMNSQLYITTRMMFSLSRAGHAPRIFGRLNARGVPIAALAAVFGRHRDRRGAECADARKVLHADDLDLDVRRAVHLAHDLRDAFLFPAQAWRARRFPAVGISVHHAVRRGDDGRDPVHDRGQPRFQDDADLWRAVPRRADAGLVPVLPALRFGRTPSEATG